MELPHSMSGLVPAEKGLGPVEHSTLPIPRLDHTHLYLTGIWATGFTLIILRLAGALLWLRLSVRNAQPASDSFLINRFQTACTRLDCGQVELRVDSRRPVPFVCGIMQRFLILPAAARDWPANRLDAVLCHELAHIKRRDPVFLLLASIGCALHWFNPFAWLAARELALEREKACDDYVLNTQVDPADYATHLISASWFAHESEVAVLAMTRRSQLEKRIMAALDVRIDRSRLTGASHLAMLCLSAVLVVPLAVLQERQDSPGSRELPVVAAAKLKAETAGGTKEGPYIAIELQTNGTSSIVLDQFDLPHIARTLRRVATHQPNSLVLIRHIGGANHHDVVRLARLCRSAGLRSTFVSNFSTNTAPHLPPEFQALSSRSRFIPINVDANGKFALRAEGFAREDILAELNDLKSAKSSVLVRSRRAFIEFANVSLALSSYAQAFP